MTSAEAKEKPKGSDPSSGKVLIVSTPSGEQGWLFKEFEKHRCRSHFEVIEFDTCKCGKVAEIGCHGIKKGEVYSEHYCEDCYNKQKKKH